MLIPQDEIDESRMSYGNAIKQSLGLGIVSFNRRLDNVIYSESITV